MTRIDMLCDLKGQGHQAALVGYLSPTCSGWGHFMAALLQAAPLHSLFQDTVSLDSQFLC